VAVAAGVCRSRRRLFGAFSIGVGTVAFLDFLGVFVIGPTTYEGSVDLRPGGIVGSVGSGLLVAAGVVGVTSIAGIWALTPDDLFWRLFGSLGLVLTSVMVAVIVLGGRHAPLGAERAAASASL
jgi:hypothetical protein